jgi:tRNA-dihydrouridine synthase
VYRKCAGGGLLRDLGRVDSILGALREAMKGRFTVKTRLGFETPRIFPELLKLLRKHSPDLVAVHTRTVADGYRAPAQHSYVLDAVNALDCPVLANGDISSAAQATAVLADHRAAGVMLGRGAVRNPWLFRQIRQHLNGEGVYQPSGNEVLEYIRLLWESVTDSSASDRSRVQRIKKHLNFIGLGVDPAGKFLQRAQRANTSNELFVIAEDFLSHNNPMLLEPVMTPRPT